MHCSESERMNFRSISPSVNAVSEDRTTTGRGSGNRRSGRSKSALALVATLAFGGLLATTLVAPTPPALAQSYSDAPVVSDVSTEYWREFAGFPDNTTLTCTTAEGDHGATRCAMIEWAGLTFWWLSNRNNTHNWTIAAYDKDLSLIDYSTYTHPDRYIGRLEVSESNQEIYAFGQSQTRFTISFAELSAIAGTAALDTSVSLSAAANPTEAGDAQLFAALDTPSADPGGVITLTSGSDTIASMTVPANYDDDQLAFELDTPLTLGTYSLTANYTPPANSGPPPLLGPSSM